MAKNVTLTSDDFEIDDDGNIRIKDYAKLKQLIDVVGEVKATAAVGKPPAHPVLKMKM